MISAKNWSKPTEMLAVLVDAPGPHSQLRIAPVALPTPNKNQVLVKVHAAGVNRADLAQRAGIYPPPPGESDVLGLEVAGMVVAIGDEKHQQWLDQAVFGLVPGGGYAEYAVIEADQLFVKPLQWSFCQAAACAEVFLTAYQALFAIGELQAGGAALVHAGASGVGTAAIAHAYSDTDQPVHQGILGMYSIFMNTFLCIVSGLVALITSVWQTGEVSNQLALQAFTQALPHFGPFAITFTVTMCIIGATLGNSFNGSRSFGFFTNNRWLPLYSIFVCFFIFVGATIDTPTLWDIADVLLPLIALPNMIGLIILARTHKKELTA